MVVMLVLCCTQLARACAAFHFGSDPGMCIICDPLNALARYDALDEGHAVS